MKKKMFKELYYGNTEKEVKAIKVKKSKLKTIINKKTKKTDKKRGK